MEHDDIRSQRRAPAQRRERVRTDPPALPMFTEDTVRAILRQHLAGSECESETNTYRPREPSRPAQGFPRAGAKPRFTPQLRQER
jgi:hypothetical protein